MGKWADKDKGIYSKKKQDKIAGRKARKLSRLKKRAERGNVMAASKLQNIQNQENLENLQANPMVSDAQVLQGATRLEDNIGTRAQGALSNLNAGQEGFDTEVIGAAMEPIADATGQALAATTDAGNKLIQMKIQDYKNRLERQRNQKAQENLAVAQIAGQTLGAGAGALAGGSMPTAGAVK